MRIIAMVFLTLFAFAVPWEYSLDLGEPLGNVARLAGMLLLIAALPLLPAGRAMRLPGAVQWLVLALYLYFVASYMWTVDGEATAEKIRAYFQVMMVVWLIWQIAEEPGDLLWMLRGFVAGCWVLALLTFADFSSTSAIAAQQIRFVAEGQDPNDVARFLDLGFPLATFLFAVERGWLLRGLALAYLPVGMSAVLLTASRGGFSGSVIALIGSAVLMVVWRPRAAAWVFVSLAVMVGALWMFVPVESIDRLSTIPEQVGAGDLNDRLSIWSSGWIAFTKTPWFGYGAGTYAVASRLAPGDTAHNTGMALLVTGGLVGLTLFLAVLVAVGQSAAATNGLMRIAMVSGLAVWLITAMVGSVEENRTTWLLFGITALAGRLSRERAAAMDEVFSARSARDYSNLNSRNRLPDSLFPAGL